MASTRNRNTPGDYTLEKKKYNDALKYNTNKEYGQPQKSYLPGHGLMPAKTCRNVLANNACDIESTLFGIGANNLETPKEPCKPQLNNLKSLYVADKPNVFVIDPRSADPKQRPMYIQ